MGLLDEMFFKIFVCIFLCLFIICAPNIVLVFQHCYQNWMCAGELISWGTYAFIHPSVHKHVSSSPGAARQTFSKFLWLFP